MDFKIVDDTPETLAIAAKYEAMTDGELEAAEKAADERGESVAVDGKNVKSVIDAARILELLRKKKSARKMYSFRLKTAVVDRLKLKAGEAGIPYQTYVGEILEAAAK